MVTIVAIPKPFEGHIGMIQRNALESWARLDGTDLLLIGDEAGVAEAARAVGALHVGNVEKSPWRTPLVSSAFEIARERSDQPLLAFVNGDIILLSDFTHAIRRIRFADFLLVGQRWNVDLREPLDFADPGWEQRLRAAAEAAADLSNHQWIDYFVLPRNSALIDAMPPFVVGRPMWDNWLLRHTRRVKIPLIDGTPAITAVHQRHDYAHVPEGTGKHWAGPEAELNTELFGGGSLFGICHATHVMTPFGPLPALRPKYLRERWETRDDVDGRFERFSRFVDPVLAPARWINRRAR